MTKRIVAKFKNDFSGIEFYDIADEYKEYTILKKQGTNEYYVWDNNISVFSDQLRVINLPKDKTKYEELLKPNHFKWFYDVVFFWADSKFVTEYGLPHYEKLVDVYKQLIEIRATDYQINKMYIEILKKEGRLAYLMARFKIWKASLSQKSSLRRLVKEFKVIW